MGIQLRELSLLLPFFNKIGSKNLKNKKILTLGVQDCYFSYEECVNFFKKNQYNYYQIDKSEILLTTGFNWAENSLYNHKNFIHQITLFRMLGFEKNNIYSLDASNYEECTFEVDLNTSIDTSQYNQYDFILDFGTFEHIFSLKNAFENIIKTCKVGGYIIHHSPIDFINHGYYNFNAELFEDVYEINNLTRNESCYIISPNIDDKKRKSYFYKINPNDFIFSMQPNYISFYYGIFMKTVDSSFKIPQQGYYKTKWSQQIFHKKEKNINFLKETLLFILKKYPFEFIYKLYLTRRMISKAKFFVI